MLEAGVLRTIERVFKDTYARRTEDRVLIYRNAATGDLGVMHPRTEASSAHVECDVELSLDVDGQTWDLAYDLHSHHVMGAFWSATDDANERLRGIVFGVFSWASGQDQWLFRRFTGQEFEAVPYEQVVGSG